MQIDRLLRILVRATIHAIMEWLFDYWFWPK